MKFLASVLFLGSMSVGRQGWPNRGSHQGDTPDSNRVRGPDGVAVSNFPLQDPCGKMFKVGDLPVIHENPDSQCRAFREIDFTRV